MLKQTITFEDYNGDTVTETHYFNMTKVELIELELEYAGGFENTVKAMIDAKNNKDLFAAVKKLVLSAYGQKSADGKRFVKSPGLSEEFSQTAAFDKLMMDLGTDDEKAFAFIVGVMPKDLADEASKKDLKGAMAERLGAAPKEKTTAELASELAQD